MVTPRRKSIRLPGYDYSEVGSYFVTIVSHHRQPLLGDVVDGEMVLSEFGRIVEFTWHDLVNHNPDIGLDEFVIMPNHVHGIIVIFEPIVGAGSRDLYAPERSLREEKPAPKTQTAEPGAGFEPAPTKKTPLSEIVRQFKTFSARRINTLRGTPGQPVWQRNYYDLIISTDHEYGQIAAYIADNPLNWLMDKENY